MSYCRKNADDIEFRLMASAEDDSSYDVVRVNDGEHLRPFSIL